MVYLENIYLRRMMSELLEKAKRYAIEWHGDQKRKYTGIPYWHHPEEVAQIVKSWGGDEAQQAAAFLHDVVEDTHATINDVRQEFGNDIAMMVGGLTDVSRPEDGNRAFRKEMDRKHVAAQPARTQLVKLADLVSNSIDITENDPNFARVYLKEKRAIVNSLDKVDRNRIEEILTMIDMLELKLNSQ